MKKVKVLVMAVVMTLCSSSAVFAADSNVLDIDAAINAAIDNSYTVKIQDISLQQAQNTYNDSSKNATQLVDQLSGKQAYDTQLQTLQSINDITLGSKYSLYQATNSKEVAKNQVKLSTYQDYESLMKFKDALDIEQTTLNNAELDYKSSQLQYDMGIISKQALKQKGISYTSEKTKFNNIQRQFNLALMKINQDIGVPLDTKYTQFSRDYYTDKPNIKTYNEYLNDALKNRAEVLNASENVKLQNSKYDTVKSFYPSKDDNPNKDAKYSVDTAENSLETNKINISIQINSLYNDLQNKYKSLDSVQKQYNQAKKDFDQYEQKYNLGLVSKLEFNTKSIAFDQAKTNLKNLQRDIWIAEQKLNYACGIGAGTAITSTGQSAQSSSGSASQKK